MGFRFQSLGFRMKKVHPKTPPKRSWLPVNGGIEKPMKNYDMFLLKMLHQELGFEGLGW